MPSPFPGMNPWLERPSLWGSVHARLIVALADDLNLHLPAHYQAEVEETVYVATVDSADLLGRPDVTVHSVSEAFAVYATATAADPVVVEVPHREEITHRWLEIRAVPSSEVVTVIEILSPVNKRSGEGRAKYESKRNAVLDSAAHFVEIDLLRESEPMPVRWRSEQRPSHYRILVSRAAQRPRADLYPFNVHDPIPHFPLPLREGDIEPDVDLSRLLGEIYDRARYAQTIDYSHDPEPPLPAEDAAWAKGILKVKT